MIPHLLSSTFALARLASTLDTRITCSVRWVQYQYCAEKVQSDPSGSPSSPSSPPRRAKHAEQRTFEQGVRTSGGDGLKGGRNDELPARPPRVWSLPPPVENLCLCLAGCWLGLHVRFPHLGLNPAPSTTRTPRTRTGPLPGRRPSQSSCVGTHL